MPERSSRRLTDLCVSAVRFKHRPAARIIGIIFLTLLGTVHARSGQALKLAVLGDSLSAEYDSITGFAGVDDPTEYAAITVPGWESMSWVEVLGRLRPGTVDLGRYGTSLLEWGVFRFSGYEYNFAIPGFEASQFEQIVNSSLFSDPQFLPYRQQIADVLQHNAQVAVVWLGANEFRANFGFLYDGNDPSSLIQSLTNNLAQVLDFVLNQNPALKLVVVNLPDLSATPDKQTAHPDPLKRANVTAATILANQAITNLANVRGLPVADVFSETEKIVTGQTVWVGPVNLYAGSDPDNNPRYEFTRDGLHPNTCLQSIIARRIVETFNQAYGAAIPTITDAEILNLTGLDPLQPYLDWAATNALANTDLAQDPDSDRLANIAEFTFDLDPNQPSPPPLTIEASATAATARYHPEPDRLRLVEVRPEWSTNLDAWAAVPDEQLSTNLDGTMAIALPFAEPSRFIRLQISIQPMFTNNFGGR